MSRSIATRTGDDGTTGLLFGRRVPKDHPQVEALGAMDELNVALGAARQSAAGRAAGELIEAVQRALVAAMGELACLEADAGRYAGSAFAKLAEADVRRLDEAVAALEKAHPGLLDPKGSGWAVPGANRSALALDHARVAARRAERRICALPSAGRTVRPELRQWVNRLSDLLWLLAREAENRG